MRCSIVYQITITSTGGTRAKHLLDMTKSESIKNLAGALCKFQSGMEAITKDATNPFFKSKYASLSAIIEDTRKGLAEQGLSYAQFPSGESSLETILMHASGEWLADSFIIKPVDSKPQSLGSAITYARRYALCSILGLQVDDDDGNEASKPAQSIPKATWQNPVKIPDAVKKDAEKKKEIQKLCDDRALVPLMSKEGYTKYVMENTGLSLIAENYDAIIKKLQAVAVEPDLETMFEIDKGRAL